MASAHDLSDPTDLAAMRAYLRDTDVDGRLAPLGLERLAISNEAHLSVADAVGAALADSAGHRQQRVVVLKDETPIMRGGSDLTRLVEAQLAGRFAASTTFLHARHKTLHADEVVIGQATHAIENADAVVAIGSGTITDIGKMACMTAGGKPYVVLQTAASVDGFTDNVSVILKNGVKRTVPSRWPDVVLADTETIAAAPRAMNTAGFGEAMSLFVAPADWYLASLLGLDDSFHPAARDILKAAGGSPTAWSAGMANQDPAAIEALVRLLAVRGMVTGITRTTACLSGVEHVISHMLDLYQSSQGRQTGLHGAQVGVGSIIAGALWHRAIGNGLVSVSRLRQPDAGRAEERLRAAFGPLGDDSAIADECWADYQVKLRRIPENWERITTVVSEWSRHADAFGDLVLPADAIRHALRSARAPTRFFDLDPAFPKDVVTWAVANAHFMRHRFTLIDLMDLMGLWDAATIGSLVDLVCGDVRDAAPNTAPREKEMLT